MKILKCVNQSSLGVPEILRFLHFRLSGLFREWWCQRHDCYYLVVRLIDREC